MGLTEADAALMVDELCNRHASTGKPSFWGGINYDELGLTGFGVVKAIEVGCEFMGVAVENATVAIQGFGAVGKAVAKFDHEKKMTVVAVSDVRGAVYHPDGLDPQALLMEFEQKGTIADFPIRKKISPGEEVTVPCDVLAPCAKEDMISLALAKNIKAKIIAEGANMSIFPDAEAWLNQQGVTYIPDFISNAGGIIGAYIESVNGSALAAFDRISTTIEGNVKII